MSRVRCSMLDFFDEHILAKIFDKIADGFDRRSWRLVCRTFMELERISRKKLTLLRAELLPNILRRFPNVEELDLSLCVGLSDESLVKVADGGLVNLNAVYLNRVGGFGNVGVFYLTRMCKTLRELDISYCPSIYDVGFIGLSQSNGLRMLKLTGCFRVLDTSMQFLSAGCLQLEVLVLKGCVGITDTGLSYIATSCKKLSFLDLSFTEITDEGVRHVAELDGLRTLKLTACNNIGDKALRCLKTKCKSLEELDISRCENLTSACVAGLVYLNLSLCMQISEEAFMEFRRSNKIQYLRLEGREINSGELPHVAAGCKQLKELSLSKTRGLTDTRISPIITECKELNKLDLTCCIELTEISMVAIASNCTRVRSLKMESCPMVMDDGLRLLLEKCSFLEELDVTDCNVSDAGLVSIGNCKRLRVLKLAFCNVTNVGISCVGAGCSNLAELDLYRCRSVGDAGVAAVVSGCQKLKVLNLSYCSRITDASMTCISRLSKLCQLEIRGCAHVTSNGLCQVAAGCKRLVELDIKRCSRIGDAGVVALEHLCPDLRQINVSYCPLTNNGLMALAKLGCMQNMKLMHLKNIPSECFGDALLNCGSLKKVKLLSTIKPALPEGVVEQLEKRGCRLRWMDKPLDYNSNYIY